MIRRYLTTSPSQTQKIGEKLAKKILKSHQGKEAKVLSLVGDLGGGKTTFLQGLAKGLGIEEKILSPTFIIMRKFSIFNFQFSNFYHIDCYRIKKPKELLDLGFKKIISDPKNIVAIEWADRVQKILPQKIIKIKFKFIDKNTRHLTVNFNKF